MKWNDLTMKERSDLMSLFLKAGVGSLSDMKKIYEEGGPLRDEDTPSPKVRQPVTSIAGRVIGWLTDKLGWTKAPTYTDGYGTVRNTEVPFKDSAQGQELKRIGETAETAGKIPFSEYSGETQIAIEQLLRKHPELYFSYGGLLHKYLDGGDTEVYGGEIAPAVVKPSPVIVDLETYPISKKYKISHSALTAHLSRSNTQLEKKNFKPFWINKGVDATYNLLTNNCSDYTGRFLENALHLKGLTKGITTPKGLSNKIRKYAYKGDINMTEYTDLDSGKYPYTVQSIEIPWYDYRKAEDAARQQFLEDLFKSSKKVSPKLMSTLREKYNKDFPKLQYYIDDKGNVIHERNSF